MHRSLLAGVALFFSFQLSHALPQGQNTEGQNQAAPSPCLTTMFLWDQIAVATPGSTDATILIASTSKTEATDTATSTLVRGQTGIPIAGSHHLLLNEIGNLVLDENEFDFTGNDCPRLLIPITTPVVAVGGGPGPTDIPNLGGEMQDMQGDMANQE